MGNKVSGNLSDQITIRIHTVFVMLSPYFVTGTMFTVSFTHVFLLVCICVCVHVCMYMCICMHSVCPVRIRAWYVHEHVCAM